MRFIHIIAAATTVLAVSSAASAQTVSTKASNSSNAHRALALIERAYSINDTRQFGKVAQMFEQAERLLPDGDREAESAARSAATILYSRGERARAQKLLERAAYHATFRGDAYSAADAFLLAITVAIELGQPTTAHRLIDRAVLIAASSNVTDDERRTILKRLAQPVSAIQLANSK
jgi:tetratricopeptide (TPR) repeat protein